VDAPGAVGAVTILPIVIAGAIVALALVRRPMTARRGRDTGGNDCGGDHSGGIRSGGNGCGHGVIGTRWAVATRRHRDAHQRATTLPDALDALSRFLRSGHSLPSALECVAGESHGPIAVQWSQLCGSVARGVDLGEAMRTWGAGDRRGDDPPREGVGHRRPDEALAAAAISIGIAFGGPRADAIESAALTLRERASARAQVRGFAAQARLSAAVISLAPLAFTSVTVASDRASRQVLFATLPGRACLIAGLVLDGIGWWWMGRICTRAAGPPT